MDTIKHVGNFSIELLHDDTYTYNSSDNNKMYKFVYKTDESRITLNKCGIIIRDQNEDEVSSAIILSAYGGSYPYPTLTAISNYHLFICASKYLYCLEIPSLEKSWQIQVDDGQAFEVFDIHIGLIVHGELSISRVSYDGTVLWSKSGPDIFVSEAGKNDFEIDHNRIEARCWNGEALMWDFDGNPIT